MLEQWTGTSRSIILIEIFVYFCFLFTLVLYIARSRVMKRCGINNSEQFEETYNSYLADRIIQNIVFREDKINEKFKPKYFIDKVRTVMVENIIIKVKFSKKDFYDIQHKLEEDEKT
jgi:hypothetical protein